MQMFVQSVECASDVDSEDWHQIMQEGTIRIVDIPEPPFHAEIELPNVHNASPGARTILGLSNPGPIGAELDEVALRVTNEARTILFPRCTHRVWFGGTDGNDAPKFRAMSSMGMTNDSGAPGCWVIVREDGQETRPDEDWIDF